MDKLHYGTGSALRIPCRRRFVCAIKLSLITHTSQAQIYEAEGNDPQTYLLLYRHAQLVLQHLSQHPEANLPENRKAMKAAQTAVKSDLAKLEQLKPRI